MNFCKVKIPGALGSKIYTLYYRSLENAIKVHDPFQAQICLDLPFPNRVLLVTGVR